MEKRAGVDEGCMDESVLLPRSLISMRHLEKRKEKCLVRRPYLKNDCVKWMVSKSQTGGRTTFKKKNVDRKIKYQIITRLHGVSR